MSVHLARVLCRLLFIHQPTLLSTRFEHSSFQHCVHTLPTMASQAAPPETINQLAQLFTNTLNPSTQKQAEANLTSLERQPEQHFSLLLLALISAYTSQPTPVRLAASIKLKNVCRQAWSDEETLELENNEQLSPLQLVPESDRAQLRASLLPLLLQLSQQDALATNPIGLRLQISECISLIADKDFPDKWSTLMDEFVTGLLNNSPDSVALQAILQTAHAIFRKWRAAFRSDALYTEINLVLEKFAQPFLQLMKVKCHGSSNFFLWLSFSFCRTPMTCSRSLRLPLQLPQQCCFFSKFFMICQLRIYHLSLRTICLPYSR